MDSISLNENNILNVYYRNIFYFNISRVRKKELAFKCDFKRTDIKVRIRGKALTSAKDEPSIRLETLPTNTASLYADVHRHTCHLK